MNASLPLLAQRVAAGSLALVLLALIPLSLPAAEPDAKLHDELRQVRAVYENAINSGDLAPLASLFAADSSGVVVDNQPFKNFADLKAIYEKFNASFPGVVYHIKLSPELSQLFGDIAVAHGTCDENVKTSDGEFTYTSTWTAVLQRRDGQWKLIRSQVTMDPFRNSIVNFFLRQAKLYYGLGALAVGLIVGFVAARLIGTAKPAAA